MTAQELISALKEMEGGIGQAASSMGALDLETTSSLAGKVSASMKLALSGAEIVASIMGMVSSYNAVKTAESVSLTSMMAANPLLWPNVAIALGTAAATAGVVYGVTSYTLKADLSVPSEQTALAQTIRGITS